jgi:transposase
MRGRKPRGVELKSDDIPQMEALLRSGKTEQRTARRTRILLGMHRGARVKQLSEKLELDPSTIWRVCRRYEERGTEAVYDAPRSGRPPEISPPRTGTD